MVVDSHRAQIGADGQLAIPDDLRRDIGLEPGDTVEISTDGRGTLTVQRATLTIEELDGILPALDREVDDDFGNLIREATGDAVERRMRRSELE